MAGSSWERYVEAEAALLDAVSQARGATKDLHREVKQHRDAIDALIAEQVTAAVDDVAADARQRLNTEVDRVVADLARDLRARLGLT